MKTMFMALSIPVLVLSACTGSPPESSTSASTQALRTAEMSLETPLEPSKAAIPGSALTATGGRLERETLRGNELLREPVREASTAPGGVMQVFGQSPAGEVLFGVFTDGGLELHRAKADGTAARPVTPPGVLGAQWAPDGGRFLYVTAGGELFLAGAPRADRPAGSAGLRTEGAMRLAEGVLAASFSPDGRQIALVRRPLNAPSAEETGASRGADEGLYILELSTGRETRLSDQVNHTRWFMGYQPAWSPDGSRIVFLGGDDEALLWVASLRSGQVRPIRIETAVPGPVTPLVWSADGRHLVYGADVLDRATELWALELREDGTARGRMVGEGRPVYRLPAGDALLGDALMGDALLGDALMVDTESGRARLDLKTLELSFLTGPASQPADLAAAPTGVYDVTYYWPLNTTAQTNITSYASHSSSSGGCSDGGSRYDCACNGSSCRTGHKGTDLGASFGTSILAAEAGTVIGVYGGCGSTTSCSTTNTSCNGGAGNYVVVQHSNGAITRYLHQKGTAATYGASVQARALLGYVGSTGSSTGCHLHFDISYSGVYYDPYYGSCSCTSKSLWKSTSTPPSTTPVPDLYGFLMNGTGTGSTEAHVLSGASNYQQFLLQTGTPLAQTNRDGYAFDLGDYDRDGKADLFVVKMNGTGTGTTELHILSGASGFQQWLVHTGTGLEVTNRDRFAFEVADYDRDKIPDLYALKMNSTAGTLEVHVLSGASGYSQFIVHSTTALAQTNPNVFAFDVGDYNKDGVPDLYCIGMNGTGSGSSEMHILSGAANYQSFLVHAVLPVAQTSSSQWNFAVGDYNRDGTADLYMMKLNGTGTATVETHIVSGASNFSSWLLHTGVPATTGTSSQWWWEVY